MNRIGISIEEANKEIELWAPQMAEHALFLNLLLVDEGLKKRSLKLVPLCVMEQVIVEFLFL